jgi:hypothetical protein
VRCPGPPREQPDEKRHEERRRHHPVEELEGRRDRREDERQDDAQRPPRDRCETAHPQQLCVRGRRPQHGLEEIAAQRGRQHEEDRVRRRDLGREESGQGETADPRRQDVGREAREGQLRVREARLDRAHRHAQDGGKASARVADGRPPRRSPSGPEFLMRPGETKNEGRR